MIQTWMWDIKYTEVRAYKKCNKYESKITKAGLQNIKPWYEFLLNILKMIKSNLYP